MNAPDDLASRNMNALLGKAELTNAWRVWLLEGALLKIFNKGTNMKYTKNTICIWYDKDAEAAARFYAKTFPDSAVGAVHRAPGDFPAGKKGDVLTVDFTVAGVSCIGLNGGPEIQAKRSLLLPDRNRRPGRNGPLLERHRQQWRTGKRVRLVQGQMGRLLADHATRLDRSNGGRRRRSKTRLRCDDEDEENRRRGD